jgi:hypothetical protein
MWEIQSHLILNLTSGNTLAAFRFLPVLDYKTCRAVEERRRDGS